MFFPDKTFTTFLTYKSTPSWVHSEMIFQSIFPRKSFPTFSAHEWFDLWMSIDMSLQFIILWKFLSTDCTKKRFLTRMNCQVFFQTVSTSKCFRTQCAVKCLFPCMAYQMYLKMRWSNKSLTTINTRVRSLHTVCFHVTVQTTALCETSSTFFTWIWFLCRMYFAVQSHTLFKTESLTTHIAGVWSFTTMRYHVSLEGSLQAKHFTANVTHKLPLWLWFICDYVFVCLSMIIIFAFLMTTKILFHAFSIQPEIILINHL